MNLVYLKDHNDMQLELEDCPGNVFEELAILNDAFMLSRGYEEASLLGEELRGVYRKWKTKLKDYAKENPEYLTFYNDCDTEEDVNLTESELETSQSEDQKSSKPLYYEVIDPDGKVRSRCKYLRNARRAARRLRDYGCYDHLKQYGYKLQIQVTLSNGSEHLIES